jgi:hypothetical protein
MNKKILSAFLLAGISTMPAMAAKKSAQVASGALQQETQFSLPPTLNRHSILLYIAEDEDGNYSVKKFDPYQNQNLRNALPESTSPNTYIVEENLGDPLFANLFGNNEQTPIVRIPVGADVRFTYPPNITLYEGLHNILHSRFSSNNKFSVDGTCVQIHTYYPYLDALLSRDKLVGEFDLFFQKQGQESSNIRLIFEPKIPQGAPLNPIPHTNLLWSYLVPSITPHSVTFSLGRDLSLTVLDAIHNEAFKNLVKDRGPYDSVYLNTNQEKEGNKLTDHIFQEGSADQKFSFELPKEAKVSFTYWPSHITFEEQPVELYQEKGPNGILESPSHFIGQDGTEYTFKNRTQDPTKVQFHFRSGQKRSPTIEICFVDPAPDLAAQHPLQPVATHEDEDPSPLNAPLTSPKEVVAKRSESLESHRSVSEEASPIGTQKAGVKEADDFSDKVLSLHSSDEASPIGTQKAGVKEADDFADKVLSSQSSDEEASEASPRRTSRSKKGPDKEPEQ